MILATECLPASLHVTTTTATTTTTTTTTMTTTTAKTTTAAFPIIKKSIGIWNDVTCQEKAILPQQIKHLFLEISGSKLKYALAGHGHWQIVLNGML